MDIKPWDILDSTIAFENRWWKIVQETVRLPDGTIYPDFYINQTPGGVVVFALTDDGNVIVNRQYKHGARAIVTELTIGRLDPLSSDGTGDGSPVEAARRELLEETGYGEGTWEELATFLSNPTSSTGRIHAFLARGVRKIAEPEDNPRERIEAREVPLAELTTMLEAGDFSTHASIATIFLALKKLEKLTITT